MAVRVLAIASLMMLIIVPSLTSTLSKSGFLQKAQALNIVAHSRSGLTAYNIMMNVKINNHPLVMELDTGMDFTLIPTYTASSLGLDQLPTVGYCSLTGIGGGPQQCDEKQVLMQIENSRPFYTKILLAPPSGSNMPPLLSTYDLYHGYRLTFTPLR